MAIFAAHMAMEEAWREYLVSLRTDRHGKAQA